MSHDKKKYRSVVRDKPRVIHSPLSLPYSERRSQPPLDTETGRLTYRRSGPKFGEIFIASERKNEEKIRKQYGNEIDAISNTFDLQYELASHFFLLISQYCRR